MVKTHDSIKVNLHTKKIEDLAIFKLHLKTDEKNLKYPLILQLTNEKATEVVRELYIEKPQETYLLQHITPNKFRLRLIEDKNANAKWDTGNFLKHQQPERLWYFPSTIELRANWEVEETWNLTP